VRKSLSNRRMTFGTKIGTMNSRLGLASLLVTFFFSCSSTQSFLGLKNEPDNLPSISNPFSERNAAADNTHVRSRVGDQVTELELPRSEGIIESYSLPSQMNTLDTVGSSDEESAAKQSPTLSDYEILAKGRQVNHEAESDRREIERELGVRTLESEVPNQRRSILTQIDSIKQLYKNRRFENALVKVDSLIVEIPTLPILYQMRGTLLERLGYADLAIQSWRQALKLEPTNQRLKRLIERRENSRGLASGGEK
jgi:tetratricopeptide (TPR) repeat protein